METAKKISSQLSLWIFIWFLLMGLALAGFGYRQMGILNQSFQGQVNPETLATLLQNGGILFLQVLSSFRCKKRRKTCRPARRWKKKKRWPGKTSEEPFIC